MKVLTIVVVGVGLWVGSFAVAWAELAKPNAYPPQHYLRGHMAESEFVVDETSSPDHSYDIANHHVHLANALAVNPRKDLWLKMKFIVPPDFDGFNRDQADWGTILVPSGTVTGQESDLSGSSLQFLTIWQTFRITPNPPEEDLYLANFFTGTKPLQLTSMEIETWCVPEPGMLILLTLGSLSLLAYRLRTGRHSA